MAKSYGAETPFLRPKELAKDDTPGLLVVQHAIRYVESKEGYKVRIVVIVQPTSPLQAKGRIDEALEHFIEVLKIVDLATVERGQADDLIQLYEHLADGYVAKGDRNQALEFTNSLVTFLSEQGWEDKVIQARQRLDVLAEQGPTLSLAEMLTTSGAESILESVSLAQEYAKRGMYYAALEECYSTL